MRILMNLFESWTGKDFQGIRINAHLQRSAVLFTDDQIIIHNSENRLV